jgi:hypothetical protein
MQVIQTTAVFGKEIIVPAIYGEIKLVFDDGEVRLDGSPETPVILVF